jgi:hypothetical protein
MNIRTIVIEGIEKDVKISRTERGAEVTLEQNTRHAGRQDICIAHITRDENRESRYAKATEVAKVVLGTDRRGRAAGTNSMIHDVLQEIERVAGC